jgi:hypothetical protein
MFALSSSRIVRSAVENLTKLASAEVGSALELAPFSLPFVVFVPRDCAEEVDEEDGTTETGSKVCAEENGWTDGTV